jgi:hypothetical protein
MNKQLSDSILDGSIAVDSPDAFSAILEQYPDNPDLWSMHADLLLKSNSKNAASQCYEKAAKMFLGSGRPLRAMVSQALHWRLSKPNKESFSSFLLELENQEHPDTLFTGFLNSLTTQEKLWFMRSLEPICLPARSIVKKVGDLETHLFFVLSGQLRESFYHLLHHRRKYQSFPNRTLKENDHFGDIYPCSEEIKSQSLVETLTRVELAKLSKIRLKQLCLKFPQVEKGIIQLLKIRSPNTDTEGGFSIRKSQRYPLQVRMSVELLSSDPDEPKLFFSGYSKDLSVTGVGFILDRCTKEDKEILTSILEKNQKITLQSVFYSDPLSLCISGQLVRLQETIEMGYKTMLLGIHFEEMPPNLQGLLFSAAKIFSSSDPSRLEVN